VNISSQHNEIKPQHNETSHTRDGRYSHKIISQYFKNIRDDEIYDDIEKNIWNHFYW